MKAALRLSLMIISLQGFTQDLTQSPWHIVADEIDPNNYYGVTVANGMVWSPLPTR